MRELSPPTYTTSWPSMTGKLFLACDQITLCVVTTPGGPTGADAVGGPVRGHVSYISEGGQHTNNYSILVTPNDLLRFVVL